MDRTKVAATVAKEEKNVLTLVQDAENKLSQAYSVKRVNDNSFAVAVDSESNVFSTEVKGKDGKVITKEVMIARTYDGKAVVEIHGADKIAAYNRVKFINDMAKVSAFAIPCELARIARENLYEVGDCDSVQAYALKFFGLSKKTTNQYIRIGEYFLTTGVNENGETYYRVKAPFNLYPSLTMGHFVEMLAYISEHDKDGNPVKDKDGNIVQKDIDALFALFEESGVNMASTTAKLRKDLIDKVKNVVDGKPAKEVANTDNNDNTDNADNADNTDSTDSTDSTMTPAQLAYLETRNAVSLISKNIEIYNDMWIDTGKALKLVNQLMKLIKTDTADTTDNADSTDGTDSTENK